MSRRTEEPKNPYCPDCKREAVFEEHFEPCNECGIGDVLERSWRLKCKCGVGITLPPIKAYLYKPEESALGVLLSQPGTDDGKV